MFTFQLELEKLNSSTDNINKLEIELDVSICAFKLNYLTVEILYLIMFHAPLAYYIIKLGFIYKL